MGMAGQGNAAPVIIKRKKVVRWRWAPWRCLESGLRRLRDRDDGLLPVDVAVERNNGKATQGDVGLLQSDDPGEPHIGRGRWCLWRRQRSFRKTPGRNTGTGGDGPTRTARQSGSGCGCTAVPMKVRSRNAGCGTGAAGSRAAKARRWSSCCAMWSRGSPTRAW